MRTFFVPLSICVFGFKNLGNLTKTAKASDRSRLVNIASKKEYHKQKEPKHFNVRNTTKLYEHDVVAPSVFSKNMLPV